jgi:hypothetical protein
VVNSDKEKKKYPVSPNMQKWLDYFDYSDKDVKVCLPNEIFHNLDNIVCPNFSFRHRAFAYSFYYLCCYLYRNAKYGSIHPLSNLYSIQLLELMYGDRKSVNYITKRNGLLDQIGYTESENDFPINIVVENGQLVDFEMYREQDMLIKYAINVPKNFICKKPVKAFKRELDNPFYDGTNNGTFFEYENVHWIDFPIFAKCMSMGSKGIEIFYAYGFLLKNEKYIYDKGGVYKAYMTASLSTNTRKTNALLEKLVSMNLLKMESPNLLKYKIRKSLNV